MSSNKSLLVLPGDGIGPEVVREVRRVIDWMDHRRVVTFNLSEGLVGGASLDAVGQPITDDTIAQAKAADAVLFGSVGGPNGTVLALIAGPRSPSSPCAKSLACSPICARRQCLIRWLKPAR